MRPDELEAENRRLLSALVKVGAECHGAKWQFDDDKDPTGIVAFRELHRIGDIAKAAIDAMPKASPMWPDYLKTSASAGELVNVLGRNWAICRPTPHNRARYGRCITPAQYEAAQREAMQRRVMNGEV